MYTTCRHREDVLALASLPTNGCQTSEPPLPHYSPSLQPLPGLRLDWYLLCDAHRRCLAGRHLHGTLLDDPEFLQRVPGGEQSAWQALWWEVKEARNGQWAPQVAEVPLRGEGG